MIACDAATPDATEAGPARSEPPSAPSRGRFQPLVGLGDPADLLQRRGPHEAKSGIRRHRLGREAVEPGEHGLEASLVPELDPVAKDQLRGIGEVPCRRGVMDRLGRVALLSVPCARPAMQRASVLGLGERELVAQELAEEVVVASTTRASCRGG